MAGVLKPDVAGIGAELPSSIMTVHYAKSIEGYVGESAFKTAVLGGTEGTYSSAHSWYWYMATTYADLYVDLTITSACNIWAKVQGNYPTYRGALTVYKYNTITSAFEYYGKTAGESASITSGGWFKLIEGLTPGRYKFISLDFYCMHSEWYLEDFSIPKFLFQQGSNYLKWASNAFSIIGTTPPTEADFEAHGNISLSAIPESTLKTITPPFRVLMYFKDNKKLRYTLNSTEVYYALSMNGTDWYSYVNGSWLQIADVYNYGMSKSEVNALTPAQLSEIFQAGSLHVKAVMNSNSTTLKPEIDSITVNLPEYYVVGNYTVITDSFMQINTMDWDKCSGCSISQTTPSGTEIKYALSSDNKVSWQVCRGGQWTTVPIGSIQDLGMTKVEMESIDETGWDNFRRNSLDVAICMMSTNGSQSPTLNQITFNYTEVPTLLTSDYIQVPVPDSGFKYVLDIDGTYDLRMADGIAFDDSTKDYDFYTTPDKIKLRMLEMGAIVGGRVSNVYEVEVINGYEDKSFNVTLAVSKDGVVATPFETYALLNDSPVDATRTRVELSLNGATDFQPVYPLTFRLDAQERRLFYIRVKPTLTTGGDTTFQVLLSGKPV